MQAKRKRTPVRESDQQLRVRFGYPVVIRSNTTLGRFIQSLRRKKGWSRRKLAERTGWTFFWIRQLEGVAGRKSVEKIRLGTAKKLANVLNTNPRLFKGFLLPASGEKEPKTESGKLIRERRRELLMTQQELADKMSWTKAFVSLVELSEEVNLSRADKNTVARLAKALELFPTAIIELIAPRKKYRRRRKKT